MPPRAAAAPLDPSRPKSSTMRIHVVALFHLATAGGAPCADMPAQHVARLSAQLVPGLVLHDCNEVQLFGLCEYAQRYCPVACGVCAGNRSSPAPVSETTPCLDGTLALLQQAREYTTLRRESWFGLNSSAAWADGRLGPKLRGLASSAVELWQVGGRCAAEWNPQAAASIGPAGQVTALLRPTPRAGADVVVGRKCKGEGSPADQSGDAGAKQPVVPRDLILVQALLQKLSSDYGAHELSAVAAQMAASFVDAPQILSTAFGLFVPRPWCELSFSYLLGGRFDLLMGLHTAADRWTDLRLQSWVRLPPLCPPLPLNGLVVGNAVDELLSPGLAATLRQSWRQIAEEVRALHFQGNAWPGISRLDTWQAITLYRMRGGWTDTCSRMPITCQLLGGRLRSDVPGGDGEEPWKALDAVRASRSGNDEEVTVFSLRGRSHVPPHVGSPLRVNVHLCLLNCFESYLELGGGPSLGGDRVRYSEGELLAFDDAVMHGIENLGTTSRVLLAIGVLHPKLTAAHKVGSACVETT